MFKERDAGEGEGEKERENTFRGTSVPTRPTNFSQIRCCFSSRERFRGLPYLMSALEGEGPKSRLDKESCVNLNINQLRIRTRWKGAKKF